MNHLLTKLWNLQAGKKLEGVEVTAIPPNQAVLKNAREHDYSLGEAIAEFVDNSIDKKVPGKPLNVEVTIHADEITVADNAMGMDYENFVHALTYGANDPNRTKGSIGEYGMGWKHASFYFANKVEMVSTQFDINEILRTEIDVKKWAQEIGFKFNVEKLEKKEPGQRGTTLKLTEITQKLEVRKAIPEVLKHLSETYEPLLFDPQIMISVNKTPVKTAERPQNIENYTELSFHFRDNEDRIHHIKGWVATKSSQNTDYKQRGFSLYTSKRRLEENSMIAIKENPKANLIVGKIYGIDFLKANISKKRFYSKNDKNYDKFEKKLFEALKNKGFFEAIREDKRESAKKIVKVEQHIHESLMEMQKILINEFDLDNSVVKGPLKEGTGIMGIADIRVHKPKPTQPGTRVSPGPKPDGGTNVRYRVGEVEPKTKTNRVIHRVVDLGESSPLIDYVGNQKDDNSKEPLTVIVNIGHPALKDLKGEKLELAILLHFITGFASGWAKKTKHAFREIYERLMRGVKL